jgi:hypothetical protein
MSDSDPNATPFFSFDAQLIRQAKAGDRESGLALLREFSHYDSTQSGGFSPEFLGYFAECFRTWLSSDCNAREAPRAFGVARQPHREVSDAAQQKQMRALRVYYLMRGRGKGIDEAIRLAAKNAHVSESAMRQYVAPESGGLTVAQGAALLRIQARVRKRCQAPPRKQYQRSR